MKKFFIVLIVCLSFFVSCESDVFTSSFKDINVKSKPSVNGSSFVSINSLTAPQHLVAYSAESTNSIKLSWSAVDGAEYYQIYRRKEGEESFIPLMVDVYNTSYTDLSTVSSELKEGIKYEYKVCPCIKGVEINEELFSNVAYGFLLSSPKNIKASKGEEKYVNSIKITWDSCLDVSFYKIYVSSSENFNILDSYKDKKLAENGKEQTYIYDLGDESKAKAGKNLYIKITAVGQNGAETDIEKSSYDIGYTYVEGAPKAPDILTADQGVNTDTSSGGIRLTWTDSGAIKYVILRSSEKQGSKQIFPFSDTDTSELVIDSENKIVSYEDKYGKNDIIPGERYTYTIIPIGEIHDEYETKEVQGLPASTDAYLLSNPSDITVKVNGDPEKKGYLLEFSNIVGLDTEEDRTIHSDWEYIVRIRHENGEINYQTIYPKIDTDKVSFLYETSDIQNVYFSVSVKNSFTQTDYTEEYVCKAPSKIINFSATQNTFIKGTQPNSNGVYPVKLTWGKDLKASRYVITRYKEGEKENTSIIAELSSDAISNSDVVSYIDTNENAKAGEIYYYGIYAIDALGRKGAELTEDEIQKGYGVLTADKYIEYWTKFCFKPFVWYNSLSTSADTDDGIVDLKSYWKNSQIGIKVDKGNSSSLSTQMDALTGGSYIYNSCHYYHGTNTSSFGRIGYSADTEGIGGQIFFVYENFGELSWMYTNGQYEMHVNASGTGTAKSSTDGFIVSGMYPAKIGINNITVLNKAFSGNYSLELNDGRGSVSVASI